MIEFFKNKRILVVVAHPDDEVLGLGATINKLVTEAGCIVNAVILGEGITSRDELRSPEKWEKELAIHHSNIEVARNLIGYQSVSTYNFPDNRFDSVDLLDLIKTVEKEKEKFSPDLIMTHHGGDVNIDHQKTFEAVITACRPVEGEKVKTIITFETMSGTEWRASSDPRHFIPNIIIPVSEKNLESKIKAMEAYEFEKRPFPHPRSGEALKIRAQMWGVAHGVFFAEAFYLVRSIA